MRSSLADLLRALPLLVVAIAVASGCDEEEVASPPDALAHLSRMLAAEDELSYRAVKRVSFGGGEDAREREFEVTHHAGGPTLWQGGDGKTRPLWPPRLYWLKDRDLLLSNYRVSVTGREPFLGRPAVHLEIEPRREGRPSMGLTLDEETGLLLATDIRDWSGRLALRSEFAALELSPGDLPPPPERRPWGRDGGSMEELPGGDEGDLGFTPLSPSFLPGGFVEKSRFASCRRPALTISFGDGLSLLTLSERPAKPEDVAEPVVEKRSYGSRTEFRTVIGDVKVTLVGQLPPEEMLRVLESLGASKP